MHGTEKSTSVVIFDARDVAQGPVHQARLRTYLSHALHGAFAPGYAPALHPRVTASFIP